MKSLKMVAGLVSIAALTACGGGGGGGGSSSTASTATLSPATPIAVLATSYANAKSISQPAISDNLNMLQYNARAFADFEHNGHLSLVVHTLEYNNSQPYNASTPHGHIHILRVNSDQSLTDITTSLIDTGTIPTGCIHARKAIVARFTGTDHPEVFFACHGFDNQVDSSGNIVSSNGTYPGELPYMMKFNATLGKYQVVQLPASSVVPAADTAQGILPYNHSATAVDHGNTGFADIIVADHNALPASSVYVLKNDGTGNFSVDTSSFSTFPNQSVWAMDLLDVQGTGTLSLWAAGTDNNSTSSTSNLWSISFNGNHPYLASTTPVANLPAGQQTATEQYGIPLDVVMTSSSLYFTRVGLLNVGGGYADSEIQQVSKSNLTVEYHAQPAHTMTTQCLNTYASWIDWIRVQSGQIITDNTCQVPGVAAL